MHFHHINPGIRAKGLITSLCWLSLDKLIIWPNSEAWADVSWNSRATVRYATVCNRQYEEESNNGTHLLCGPWKTQWQQPLLSFCTILEVVSLNLENVSNHVRKYILKYASRLDVVVLFINNQWDKHLFCCCIYFIYFSITIIVQRLRSSSNNKQCVLHLFNWEITPFFDYHTASQAEKV